MDRKDWDLKKVDQCCSLPIPFTLYISYKKKSEKREKKEQSTKTGADSKGVTKSDTPQITSTPHPLSQTGGKFKAALWSLFH